MKTIIISIQILLLFFLFGCNSYTTEWNGQISSLKEGSGTPSDPFLISSSQELAYIARKVSEGNNFSGNYFKLTTDLDMRGDRHKWISYLEKSIYTYTFSGIFDGNGFTISNISGDVLFLSISPTGIIRNLTLKNHDYNHSEGTFAKTNYGLIENCNIKGIIKSGAGFVKENKGIIDHCICQASFDPKHSHISGFCTINTGTISRSAFEGRIVTNIASDVSGFVKEMRGGVIKYCYNRGLIDTRNHIKTYYEDTFNVGSIIGEFCQGKIEDCYNRGELLVDLDKNTFCGFIGSFCISRGTDKNRIENCYDADKHNSKLGLTYAVDQLTQKSRYKNCYFSLESFTEYQSYINNMPPSILYGSYLNEWNKNEFRTSGKKESFMKTKEFVKLLNGNRRQGPWIMDSTGENNGFPVLDIENL